MSGLLSRPPWIWSDITQVSESLEQLRSASKKLPKLQPLLDLDKNLHELMYPDRIPQNPKSFPMRTRLAALQGELGTGSKLLLRGFLQLGDAKLLVPAETPTCFADARHYRWKKNWRIHT